MTLTPNEDDLREQLEAVQADDEASGVVRLLYAQAQAAKTLQRSLASLTQEVPPEVASRAQATENAWREMGREFGMLTSAEVGELVGSTSKSPKSYAADARKGGRILGVKRMNKFLYPAFQFDQGKPLPVVRRLWSAAERFQLSDETILLWLTAPITWWGDDSRPVDHLDEPDEVLHAFESHYGAEW